MYMDSYKYMYGSTFCSFIFNRTTMVPVLVCKVNVCRKILLVYGDIPGILSVAVVCFTTNINNKVENSVCNLMIPQYFIFTLLKQMFQRY